MAISPAFAAGWEDVQRISPDRGIDVVTRQPESTRGTFVSANDTVLVVRTKSGERSIARGDIRRVLVRDPSRRIRNGLIATAIGAGIGLAIGVAVCPYCWNEGAGAKYAGPATAAGAGLGAAAGFLPAGYRTVYKSK